MTRLEAIYDSLRKMNGREFDAGDSRLRVAFDFEENLTVRGSGLPEALCRWVGRRFADRFDRSGLEVSETVIVEAIVEICNQPSRALAVWFSEPLRARAAATQAPQFSETDPPA